MEGLVVKGCRGREAALVALALLSGGAESAGQAVRPDSLPPGVSVEQVERGKGLYEGAGLCFACHGLDGRGAVGADLTDSLWIHHDGSFSAIVAQVLKGVATADSRSGTPMPARGGSGLGDDDIRAVAAYVWTLSRRKPGR